MLLINGTIATFGEDNRLIPNGAILVRDGTIADIGATAELLAKYPDAEQFDAAGKLVLPGLICAHTHFYGAFARGMGIPGAAPSNFPEILEKLWWRLDKSLDYEGVRYSALVCLVDAIKHGTTTLIDHHASPNAIDGSLDVIAEAITQSGLRASLCYEVTDRDGPERAALGIRENERFIREARDAELLAGSFGLHASLTLSDETLEKCRGAARDLDCGFHIHVAEDVADQKDSLAKSGERVVARLAKWGIMSDKSIAVHCVHVDDSELEILRETGARVVHNPRSNMNNAVGVADVLKMLERDIHVGLGNDGFSNNMFTGMHTTYLVHKLARRDPRVMGADTVMRMAFQHNAETARIFFPQKLGELSIGAAADMAIVNYHPTTPLNADNLPWHIIFGIDGTGVDTTIVAGRVLMRGGELLTLDEAEICAKSREVAARTWERVSNK